MSQTNRAELKGQEEYSQQRLQTLLKLVTKEQARLESIQAEMKEANSDTKATA